MTYSWYSKSTAARLGIAATAALAKTLDLMAPLSEEQAVMRTNLVHHLWRSWPLIPNGINPTSLFTK